MQQKRLSIDVPSVGFAHVMLLQTAFHRDPYLHKATKILTYTKPHEQTSDFAVICAQITTVAGIDCRQV